MVHSPRTTQLPANRKMTLVHEFQSRSSSFAAPPLCLEDKFEVLKDIGDGSFGSVALARVRTAGSHVAKRGSFVSVIMGKAIAVLTVYLGCHQDDEEDI